MDNTNKYNQHEINWTPEKISNFWDYASGNKYYNEIYFSKIFGNEIIDVAEKYYDFNGRVVDYGCGPGYLMGYLMDRGIACRGLDFSGESVNTVNNKFKDNPLFRGVIKIDNFPSSLDSESVDFVFLVETIEHLLPGMMEETLTEINRILKKGGVVMITTPNEENLEKGEVICPECGCTFHRMQHINTYSSEDLTDLMAKYGLEKKRF